MKIISLNIRHGGGQRTPSLMGWLLRQSPDLIILPEWRDNESGCKIVCGLQKEGFTVSAMHKDTPANGILVAAKVVFDLIRATPPGAENGELGLASFPLFRLCAAYFPQRNHKAIFFKRCFALAENPAPLLLIGDLNTGRNDLDLTPGAALHFSALTILPTWKPDAALRTSGACDMVARGNGHGTRQKTGFALTTLSRTPPS